MCTARVAAELPPSSKASLIVPLSYESGRHGHRTPKPQLVVADARLGMPSAWGHGPALVIRRTISGHLVWRNENDLGTLVEQCAYAFVLAAIAGALAAIARTRFGPLGPGSGRSRGCVSSGPCLLEGRQLQRGGPARNFAQKLARKARSSTSIGATGANLVEEADSGRRRDAQNRLPREPVRDQTLDERIEFGHTQPNYAPNLSHLGQFRASYCRIREHRGGQR